jgi:hypothetical protein
MTQDHPPPPAAPVEQIVAEIIAAFLRMIAGREPWIKPVPLTATMRALIGDRVLRHARRFAAIAARWRAGTLRRLPRRAVRDPDAPRPEPSLQEPSLQETGQPRAPRVQNPITRVRGWVGQATGWQGRGYGGQVEYLVRTNPEMRALLEAAPQLGDVLRPLLRMFGSEVEPWLLPPSRRRPAPPRPSPRPSRDRPRRRTAQASAAAPAAPEPVPAWDAPIPEPTNARGRLLSPQEVLRRNPWLPHHPKQRRTRLAGYTSPVSKKPA